MRTNGIDIFVPMGQEDNGLNDDFEGWYDAMMYNGQRTTLKLFYSIKYYKK